MTKLKGLEDRETNCESHIVVQEDTIQILSAEVEELKGKMCCCQDSPRTLGARGPGTCDYILRTLRGLVKFTCISIAENT